MSAAMGKIGAFLGVYLFGAIASASSFGVVMVVSAIISSIGAVISYKCIRDHEGAALATASSSSSSSSSLK